MSQRKRCRGAQTQSCDRNGEKIKPWEKPASVMDQLSSGLNEQTQCDIEH